VADRGGAAPIGVCWFGAARSKARGIGPDFVNQPGKVVLSVSPEAVPVSRRLLLLRWRQRIERLREYLRRWPWLLPAISFAAGWIGFALVQRGYGLARLMALLAIIGWPWLLLEPLVRRQLSRRAGGRLSNLIINFITQSLQQELLFFSLPLLIGATQPQAGQIAFVALATLAALLSTIDPLYERHVAARPATSLLFHAYCSWIAALTVLPIVLHLPLERALPVSLIAVGGWLVLALPRLLASLPGRRQRLAWLALLVLLPLLPWTLRGQIPAAGLSVSEARMTRSLHALVPGEAVTKLRSAELADGVVAFVAIRAPMGVAQSIVFEWRHGGDSERIDARVHGGNESGWRTWSRKQNFPQDARGLWLVDVKTPQGQLLRRLRFEVE